MQAHISIENDTILIDAPFSTDYVRDLQAEQLTKWDKVRQVDTAPFSITTLRRLLQIVSEHHAITYDENVKPILDNLTKSTHDPTLELINGNPMIVAITPELNIETTMAPSSIMRTKHHGVVIGQSILDTIPDDLTQYILSSHKITLPKTRFHELIHKLSELGVNYIFCNLPRSLPSEFTEVIGQSEIPTNIITRNPPTWYNSKVHTIAVYLKMTSNDDEYMAHFPTTITIT